MQKAHLHFQYLSLAAKRKGNKQLSISGPVSAPACHSPLLLIPDALVPHFIRSSRSTRGPNEFRF